jgi:MoxR-like ATPase
VTALGSKDLVERCETAATLYHRLVLLVGPAGSGKTRLLQQTSQSQGWPLVNP